MTVSHVHSTFCICWGAQAAIFSHHGVGKHRLSHKAFGVFRHKNLNPASPYLRGFSDDFSFRCRAGLRCGALIFRPMPVSRS